MASELVSVKEFDYLDEDKPIRGQNYVCMSFLNPEDVLKNKEAFYFEKFLVRFSEDMKQLFTSLKDKYPESAPTFGVIEENHDYVFNPSKLDEQYRFFKNMNSTPIEKEFHEQNQFRPTMRGIKIRGSFDTLEEAKVRAQVLKRMGDKFDIFVGQVGCWCPWSPNPEDLQEQEYAETQLNTMMKKYKENQEVRDIEFNARRQAKIDEAARAAAEAKLKAATEASSATPSEPVEAAAVDGNESPAESSSIIN